MLPINYPGVEIEYCISKKMDNDIEKYDKKSLNKLLSHFYSDARKTSGEKYKVNSLENMRFSVNRFFQQSRIIAIIKDRVS